MRRFRLISAFVAALAMLPVAAALAQVGPATDYVTWTMSGPAAPVAAGGTARLTIEAAIAPGWKMYAMDSPRPSRGVELRFEALPPGFRVQARHQATPRQGFDPNFNIDVRYFEEAASFEVDLAVASSVAPGPYEVQGVAVFMICNDRLCLPPTRAPLSASVTVEPAGASPPALVPPEAGVDLGTGAVGTAADRVAWTAQVTPPGVAPGGRGRLTLTAVIDAGWKMYALDAVPPGRRGPVAVAPAVTARPEAVTVGGWEQTPPEEGFDPNFGFDVRYFEGEATLWAPVEVAPDAEPGRYPIEGTVRFMVCNDRICLPPTQTPFSATVAVAQPDGTVPDRLAGTAARAEPGEERAPGAEIVAAGDLDAARSGGLWAFLLLAVGAGLAALLTPCVFPMIPLTVSYFTRHAERRGEAVRMAGVYGLAIVLTFTGLGVLMALLVGAAGAQAIAANPWVNLFIGLVFVFFALSLLGWFELRLPSRWLNAVNRLSHERRGYLGVVFMGLTLTLVSFSCTAPFVGALLAATAGGEWSWPILGMLVFSATFALPFVLFAMFPNRLHSLPRSGMWMQAVKVTLGFVELAAALKFLSNADLVWGWNLLSRPLAIALTIVIFSMAGLYLIGRLRMAHEPPVEEVGVGRVLAAIGFFGVALYMLPGLFGAPLNALDAYLPPRQATDVSLLAALPSGSGAGTHDEGWFTDDIDAAFEEARRLGQPVFIDFTGYTCTNCRAMEANVFPHPAVAERFERDFVRLRLYTDGPQADTFQPFQLRLTRTTALPTYAIVAPNERRLLAQTSGMMTVDEFVAFLDRGAAAFRQQALASRAD